MAAEIQLSTWDYVSMIGIILMTGLVGVYHIRSGAKLKLAKDFLVNSREMGSGPLILSILASFFSAASLIGVPVETYVTGLNFALLAAANLLLIPMAIFLYIPVFYQLNRDSIFEYLELRFGLSIRLMASICLSIQMLLYSAVTMYAPALIINQVTGMNLWASVATVSVLCTIYTAFGGFKAVVWADVTQMLVFVAVLSIIIIKGVFDIGGFAVVWDRMRNGQRTDFFIWSSSSVSSQYSAWTMLIGNTFYRFTMVVLNQSQMQRYLSNRTLKRAQISCVVVCVSIVVIDLGYILLGALLFARYYRCDPLLDHKIPRDNMVPLYAVETLSFSQGLSGVFVAAILCATISTLSSLLNSLSIITISDYVKQMKPEMKEETVLKLSKCLVVVFGVLAMTLVAIIKQFGSILKALFAIFGITSGPILAAFSSGMFLPWVHTKGVAVGFVASSIIPVWACVGNLVTQQAIPHAPFDIQGCCNETISRFNSTLVTFPANEKTSLEYFYSLSSLWYISWSLVIGLVVSLAASKLLGGFRDPKTVDSSLLFPFIRRHFANHQQQTKEEELKMSANKVICPLITQS